MRFSVSVHIMNLCA